MSVNIIYFVHGTTTDNEKGLSTGWLPGELSELGIKQSKELKKITENEKFDVVFCSDLKRAIDSANLSFAEKCQIIPDKRLREANYGDFNGRPESFKTNPKDFINKPFPSGECYLDVQKRVKDFLVFLNKEFEGSHIAIVAHQAPQLALEVLCNKKTWEQAIETDWRTIGKWQAGWKYYYL
jgi:broad specificity phosphatase PhoE